MVHSRRYNKLISRIRFIENSLLPNIRINGNYTKKESDLIRSYILLVHAEVESFLEDIAEEKALKCLRKWNNGRKRSNSLLSILAFCSSDIDWNKGQEHQKLTYRVNFTIKHYINQLKRNHGIKKNNILSILLPLGIEKSNIDSTWLITMESFGAQRGLIAHSTVSVQNQIDLVTEKNNINNLILPEIGTLDLAIKSLQ
jgi:hypothetical protein